MGKTVKQSELVSKRDDEGESRMMEMAEGRGKDNAGEKRSRGCEIWGLMEDKRGEVIRNCRLGSLASLMKRCQNVFGSHWLHYCPQTRISSGTICHKTPSKFLLAEYLTLCLSLTAMGLYNAQATWILSKDEAKLVRKPSPSEIKTQLKPHE